MTNVIQFPEDSSRIHPREVLERVLARIESGDVQYLMVVTMDHDTNCKTAMSTIPAHCAVYMNQLQRMSIEKLMDDKGMVP